MVEKERVGHGEGFASGFGSDERVAVAVAADPGAEGDELREIGEGWSGVVGEFGGEGGSYFSVEDGQRVEEGGLVVVEGHADLVTHGGAGGASIVGLPECGDFGGKVAFEGVELGVGDGDAVELLEEVRDAAAFEHDAASSDFSGMGREDRRDADLTEEIRCSLGGDTGLAEDAECSAKTAALNFFMGWIGLVEGAGEAAALAVVGFGQVDELKVEAEGASEAVGAGEIERTDASDGLLEMRQGGVAVRSCVCLATGDGGAAKSFYGVVEGFTSLLAEDEAEEVAERADIAAEGGFFEVGGIGLEFGQAVRPVRWSPK